MSKASASAPVLIRCWLFLTSLCLCILVWWAYISWQNRPVVEEIESPLHQFHASWPIFVSGLAAFGPFAVLGLCMAAVTRTRGGGDMQWWKKSTFLAGISCIAYFVFWHYWCFRH